ncbi:MAG: flagellar assembly protein FliW [Bdellovibrionales bacterium]|nr:flagellar assembly protein FliW [Bdellovibrionales bacterium]
MVVNTTRFGTIDISEEDILTFTEGLLGFNDLEKFVLLDDPNDEIFAWLQSCDEPSIAFPVLEPELFEENFKLRLTKSDLQSLKSEDSAQLRSFCIITIPEDPARMTANLKAPVVVNVSQRLARQCVLQDNKLEIREPIFSKLQQRVVQHNPEAIKSQVSDWGVAVRLKDGKRTPEAEM